tara:strand:+ start:188 stop:382 length:195 start_codon:yes stop_codon:yes gene_type:complete
MLKKYLHISFGVLLVVIGLIGGLIPIFQGWVFGIPGLIILSRYFPKVNKLVSWAKRKAKPKKSI